MRPRPTRDDRDTTGLGVVDFPEFEFAALPFEDFNRRIDEGLAALVAQWEHLAAPASQRQGRISPIKY